MVVVVMVVAAAVVMVVLLLLLEVEASSGGSSSGRMQSRSPAWAKGGERGGRGEFGERREEGYGWREINIGKFAR